MTTLYSAKRRAALASTRAHNRHMHHIAWGIVCALLIAVVSGLWVHSQSLESANRDLRRQLAVAQSHPKTCKVKDAWTANTSKEYSVVTKDGERRYIVHVPADFQDGQYYPLVFFYTGKGASPVESEAAFGLDALPTITVYPYPTIGLDGATAWDGAPYASGADDVAFTQNILEKVQSDLCIDKTRVYATGFSNGGGFAALLSCKLPGRFAAYAVVAGALYYPYGKCLPPKPSPLMSIHGDDDKIVPYNGVLSRNLPPVYSWASMRAKAENCKQPTMNHPRINIEITTWGGCRSGSSIQNIRIVGGIHAWGEVSNDTLWSFLSRFSL